MAKNISREGHRQRIRNAYLKSGVTALPPHNVLELILTYSIPRKDVKDIVYNLFNTFGGELENIFSADIEELEAVSGAGENTAILIKLFADIMKRMDSEKGSIVLDNFTVVKEYVSDLMSDLDCESVIVAFVTNSNEVISYKTLAKGDVCLDKIELKEIVEGVVTNNAASIIVAHNYPNDTYNPKDADISFAERIAEMTERLKINLADYITVGTDGVLSMANDIRYLMYLDSKYKMN